MHACFTARILSFQQPGRPAVHVDDDDDDDDDDGDDDDDDDDIDDGGDDDDDDGFYVELFSALEQTHCAFCRT